MWEEVVNKNHPEEVATGRVSVLFKETCLTDFRSILNVRKKQTSLDNFFIQSACENDNLQVANGFGNIE